MAFVTACQILAKRYLPLSGALGCKGNMAVGFELVNISKNETIGFLHLPVITKMEIVRNPVSSLLVTYYLSENQGDLIQFVSDTYDDWPFSFGKKSDMNNFEDVTDIYIDKLIRSNLIIDCGFEYQDEDEPDNVYIRSLKCCSETTT
ncbi:hypothetical protein [Thalassotalea sp. Y01]|uniref:hypothetical protein n=1 Tax=Thalassotalea sp. Y01 TaxID=2729613 RepID=UPI00145F4410|nr:hypothetical protein [Thalassotalea sp. Y01]NMP16344.1 hypothetical protein [Thalassotalea sp. Y01]